MRKYSPNRHSGICISPYTVAGSIISSTTSIVAPDITGGVINRRRCALRRFAPGISPVGSGCTRFASLLGWPVTSMPKLGTCSVGWSTISLTGSVVDEGGEIDGWPRIRWAMVGNAEERSGFV